MLKAFLLLSNFLCLKKIINVVNYLLFLLLRAPPDAISGEDRRMLKREKKLAKRQNKRDNKLSPEKLKKPSKPKSMKSQTNSSIETQQSTYKGYSTVANSKAEIAARSSYSPKPKYEDRRYEQVQVKRKTTPFPPRSHAKKPCMDKIRYVIYLVLICMSKQVSTKQHILEGYDCTKPTTHQLIPSPCLKQVIWNQEARYTGWVAYHAKDRLVSGLRCTAKVSLQSYYCGTSSHIHLLDTPITEVITLTPSECNQVYKTRSITVYNKIYSVEPDTGINVHGIIVNGTLTYGYSLGVFDVFCNPTGIRTANHFVDYGFQVGTLSVSVTTVPLLVTSEDIIDYQKSTRIGHWSNCTRGCTAITGSYYIPGDHTRYRLVKQLSFHKYKQGNQVFIVNHTENVHIEMTRITRVKINNRLEQVLETELPDLVLFTNPDMKDKIPKLHSQEARYDIASWINTLYKYKQLQTEIDQQVQYETCVRTHRDRILPTTHYAKGKAITSLGELMRVSTCTPVNVTITEGKMDDCYTNHISVQVNNVTKIMLPGSRIVFDTTDLTPVSCENHPVFIYIGNHSYLGNRGKGIEQIIVQNASDHFKTHIFWSPIDDAIQDLTIVGDKTSQNEKVTYLNELTGTPSISQTTADQVNGLESMFDWTFGKGFSNKIKTYLWSIISVMIITALTCYLACAFLKFICKRLYTCKFLPIGNLVSEIEME